MVRVEVTEKFTLGNDKRFKFEDLEELQRKDINKDDYNTLYVGDKFLCKEDMALYLGGKNPINKVVVKAIEVIPVQMEDGSTQKAYFIPLEEDMEDEKETIKETKPKTTRGRKKKEE